ncbi:MAG TPA: SHOCT domain-containing protein [Desulfosporosinus sp.]|nr:SHOCT domain-containing protein [Desulfosporosinus sp.]
MFGLVLILLCIGAYLHYKQQACGCHPHTPKQSHGDALNIVRARYARGEMTREEFNERNKTLE